jgi:hypothetical protein
MSLTLEQLEIDHCHQSIKSLKLQIKKMKRAWKDLGLKIEMDDPDCWLHFDCIPGLHSRTFKGVRGATQDHRDVEEVIKRAREILE